MLDSRLSCSDPVPAPQAQLLQQSCSTDEQLLKACDCTQSQAHTGKASSGQSKERRLSTCRDGDFTMLGLPSPVEVPPTRMGRC